jgi:hypothetical protein
MSPPGRSGRVGRQSGSPSIAAALRRRREPPVWATALNRCAIARCAGSPTASATIGGEIVDSGRGGLS